MRLQRVQIFYIIYDFQTEKWGGMLQIPTFFKTF